MQTVPKPPSGLRDLIREGRARAIRRLCPRPTWVAVTGSVGKTTTTVLTEAALATRGRGVARPMIAGPFKSAQVHRFLRFVRPWHRHVVLEFSGHIGREALGRLTRLVRPRIAVVTTVRGDHRTTFGTLEATADTKAELVRHLRPDDVAVLNADDPLVWAMRHQTRARVVGFGASPEATLRLEGQEARWPRRLTLDVRCGDQALRVPTRLVGSYGAGAVLAALATAYAAGIDLEAAAAAIGQVEPVDGRMSPVETPDGITFIDNAWKSPIHALPLSFAFLAEAQAARKVAVIGSVSDYAGSASEHYRQVARQALAVADVVAFSGPWESAIRKVVAPPGKTLLRFKTTAEARAGLRALLRPGDLVLLQGSGRMDHFDRLTLDRVGAVACWSSACRAWVRCRDCRFLNAPHEPTFVVEGQTAGR